MPFSESKGRDRTAPGGWWFGLDWRFSAVVVPFVGGGGKRNWEGARGGCGLVAGEDEDVVGRSSWDCELLVVKLQNFGVGLAGVGELSGSWVWWVTGRRWGLDHVVPCGVSWVRGC